MAFSTVDNMTIYLVPLLPRMAVRSRTHPGPLAQAGLGVLAVARSEGVQPIAPLGAIGPIRRLAALVLVLLSMVPPNPRWTSQTPAYLCARSPARLSSVPLSIRECQKSSSRTWHRSSIDDPKAPNRALDKRNRLRQPTTFAYCADEGAAQIWLHADARAIS